MSANMPVNHQRSFRATVRTNLYHAHQECVELELGFEPGHLLEVSVPRLGRGAGRLPLSVSERRQQQQQNRGKNGPSHATDCNQVTWPPRSGPSPPLR